MNTEYRNLNTGDFWREIYDVDEKTFLSHSWQATNSVTDPKKLRLLLQGKVSDEVFWEVESGLRSATMSMRITPYVISLINWNDAEDPLRKQFIPRNRSLIADHPKMELDSLHEQKDAPVLGLIHRYTDKALFLAQKTCPTYCRFCTRSYGVGLDTEVVKKIGGLGVNSSRWQHIYDYIRLNDTLEDIVISGGDSYHLRPEHIEEIGNTLLNMPNIRRIRYATKGLAIMPQKVLTDHNWADALARVNDLARKLHKEVVIHTHFNHPSEVTWITQKSMNVLHERGITVRNQSVLLRGVNDNPVTMTTLVKRLGYLNIQPYYVYICDMVKGVEDLRTDLQTAIDIEKHVRGSTAGFNTPTFVCDAPGGGGKRSVHSYEYYNRNTGISVYTAPSVKPGKLFFYFDPLHSLKPEIQKDWFDVELQRHMIQEATEGASCNHAHRQHIDSSNTLKY